MMKVQHGDIVVFHGHGFVSQAIQFFMNVWRWVNFQFKPFYKKVPNHIAMGAAHNTTYEAIENGIRRTDFAAKSKNKKLTLKVYRYPWSEKQSIAIESKYNKYYGTPYQYSNFIFWIVYILTFGKVWVGGAGYKSDRKLYCSEFAARIIYEVTSPSMIKSLADINAHKYFKDYWKINPLQVERWCETSCELVATYEINNGVVTEIKQ